MSKPSKPPTSLSKPTGRTAQPLVKNASAKKSAPPAPPRPAFEILFMEVFQMGSFSLFKLPSGKIITDLGGEMILHNDEESFERYLNKIPKNTSFEGIDAPLFKDRLTAMYLFSEAGSVEINELLSAFPVTPAVLRELLLIAAEQSIQLKNKAQIKRATAKANKAHTQNRKTMFEVFYGVLESGEVLGGKGFAKNYATRFKTTQSSVNRARNAAEKLYLIRHAAPIEYDCTSEGLPF